MPGPIVAGAPRRTRQIRATAVLLLTLAFLGFAFYKAYSYISDDPDEGPTTTVASVDCVTGSEQAPVAKVSATVVNIYNATTTTGLAASVADQMRERGYQIGEIANDPLRRSIEGVAEIRYGGGDVGPTHARAARLAVRDAELVRDKRADNTVDLVLGNGFEVLSPLPKCARP